MYTAILRTLTMLPGDNVKVSLTASAITTERLTLTPLEEDDADAMVEVYEDQRMHEFTGGHPLSLGELRSRYRRLTIGHSPDRSELWCNWIVRAAVDGQTVGAMQATIAADGSSADVAWEVGVRWQGTGVASEAASAVVRWLIDHDVQHIRALIHPDHRASSRVAERAGLAPTTDLIEGEVVWTLDRLPRS